MSGITDLVQQQLTPDRIGEISKAIGADPSTTRQAVDAALPMIVGGMAAHAATPGRRNCGTAEPRNRGTTERLWGRRGRVGS